MYVLGIARGARGHTYSVWAPLLRASRGAPTSVGADTPRGGPSGQAAAAGCGRRVAAPVPVAAGARKHAVDGTKRLRLRSRAVTLAKSDTRVMRGPRTGAVCTRRAEPV